MSAAGRQAYRTQLVNLLAEAEAVRSRVGNTARVGDIITCLAAVIAQIDTLPARLNLAAQSNGRSTRLFLIGGQREATLPSGGLPPRVR